MSAGCALLGCSVYPRWYLWALKWLLVAVFPQGQLSGEVGPNAKDGSAEGVEAGPCGWSWYAVQFEQRTYSKSHFGVSLSCLHFPYTENFPSVDPSVFDFISVSASEEPELRQWRYSMIALSKCKTRNQKINDSLTVFLLLPSSPPFLPPVQFLE